ncbi:MAG TPA: CBS domain-containing protein [candidate division Zixibacteria bacterium]|nr:CBS domain-containing protein [candidate division Zixibacteria bacterium]
MKVRDIMMSAPKYCRPDTNLASVVEILWVNDCGFLPVVDRDERVAGVITDRDICIALGTRNQRASDVLVREVMTERVYACAPEDDIHSALETMEKHQVRRLPVVNLNGKLAGILSIGDVTLHAEKREGKKIPDLSSEEVVEAYQGIRVRQLTEQVAQL